MVEYRCDKCGKNLAHSPKTFDTFHYVFGNVTSFANVATNVLANRREVDLCSECANDVLVYLTSLSETQ